MKGSKMEHGFMLGCLVGSIWGSIGVLITQEVHAWRDKRKGK